MDFELANILGKIQSATHKLKRHVTKHEETYYIRKANKISTVLSIMNFCQQEWFLSFDDQSKFQKHSENNNGRATLSFSFY